MEGLYRAKTYKNNNSWVDGFYANRKETTYCFTEDYERCPVRKMHFIIKEYMTDWGLPNEFKCIQINPSTLCRFTGKFDRNGKPIYEHDIVKTQYGRLCMVEWFDSDSYCGFDLIPINTKENLDKKPPSEYFLWFQRDIEVVGNIFDNESLLK